MWGCWAGFASGAYGGGAFVSADDVGADEGEMVAAVSGLFVSGV